MARVDIEVGEAYGSSGVAARRPPDPGAGERSQPRRFGRRSWRFTTPRVAAVASIAGPEEGIGPLADRFDQVTADDLLGQASWERAESEYLRRAVELAIRKADRAPQDVDFLFAGDLMNQIVSSSFAARGVDIPYLGLYAACATLTEGLALAAMAIEGGFARCCVVGVTSHHDAAERQLRFPTEFGNQRPPSAQWTATGAAAVVLSGGGDGPRVRAATIGRVVDLGVKSPFEMGAAMAPAAADTLDQHFRETGREPDDYDLVITGDLAAVGVPLCERLLRDRGHRVRLDDCGLRLYDRDRQDVHAGGSGAACSGLVFAADLHPRLREGRLGDLLLCCTGALHSTTTYQQGETIPAICHAVWLSAGDGEEGRG